MDGRQEVRTLLGVDLGCINTRVSLFGLSEAGFRLAGSGLAASSLGGDSGIETGVRAALQDLERHTGWEGLDSAGDFFSPASGGGRGFDRAALAVSGGPLLRMLALGLTEDGSLRAVRALADSLPLRLIGALGMGDLESDPETLDRLVRMRPEVLLVTGGEDGGAEAPVQRLVELSRLACLLLPRMAQPLVLYAGNAALADWVRRRLEPMVHLRVAANVQPSVDRFDLLPAQSILDDAILRAWTQRIAGLREVTLLADRQQGTKDFLLSRMVRFLNRAYGQREPGSQGRGVLALDLGGGSTTLAAALGEEHSLVHLPAWQAGEAFGSRTLQKILQWVPVQVGPRLASMYFNNHALHPGILPSDVMELALSQALARVRIRSAMRLMSNRYPFFQLVPEGGLASRYEPVIASGAALTNAPTPGQSMLILLDALQPRGVTTLVLDRNHILPALGASAERLPLLPVQALDSGAFLNLGTVIAPVSSAPAGRTILVLKVSAEDGESYTAEITQGSLRRLPLPLGTSARLTVTPTPETDVGFGGPGASGRIAITGGALGFVVDARGRPLRLETDEEARLEQVRGWLWALGG